MALLFYAASATTHLLVLGRVIPYDRVNGGLSQSYASQAGLSLASLVILGLLLAMVWSFSKPRARPPRWQQRILIAVTFLWIIGFFAQVFGTNFERYVLSVVMAVGVISHARLLHAPR